MKGCEKMRLKRLLSLLISSAMTISVMPLTAFAAEKEAPVPSSVNEAMLSDNLQINYIQDQDSWDYIDNVHKIMVNDNQCYKAASSISMEDDGFYCAGGSYYIELGKGYINNIEPNEIVISADGYEDIELTVEKSRGVWSVSVSEPVEDVDVTEIKLSETSLELKKSETKKLTATVEPKNATNKEVEWESDDTNVATVENGTVTAVGAGEATITVTSVGNEEVTAICEVTVTEEKETVTFTGRKAKGENIWDEYYVLKSNDKEYINGIEEIYVNRDKWIKYFYKNSLREKGYFLDGANGEIYFYAIKLYQDDAILEDGDIIKITNPDYEDALLKVSIDGDDFSVSEYDGEEEKPEEGTKTVEITAEKINIGDFIPEYYYALMPIDDTDYIDENEITKILVNDKEWASDEISFLYGEDYYIDEDNDRILFATTGYGQLKVLSNNNIVKIVRNGYEDVVLQVTILGDEISVKPYEDGEVVDEYNLYVKIEGYFEPAVVGQTGYEEISYCYADVYGVILPKGEEPDENTKWKPLNEIPDVDGSRSKVVISPEGSGMTGNYTFPSISNRITLSGTPEKEGNYTVKVEIVDENGRKAESNEIPFVVYDAENVTLEEQLKIENCEYSDGKYIYKMEPWVISTFGGENETVTVPEDIKEWHGSPQSGTYGVLGKYANTEGETLQTLIIPKGCDLEIVNMEILSGVRIIVRGTLDLNDTSVDGIIEVQDGGKLTMNYDEEKEEFTNGAIIHGQIILQDGATVENAKIYSFAYSDSDPSDTTNADTVVVVKGNVDFKGKVYIEGDGFPGDDGQDALKVENGTVNIDEDSVLAVFGGGENDLTANGGDGIVLDNGKITGDGKLISLGALGWIGDGGDAVSGNGEISVKNVYLEAGSSYLSTDGAEGGKALGEGVTLAETSNRNLINGKSLESHESTDRDTYWTAPLGEPDLSLYEIPENDKEEETVAVESVVLNKQSITLEKGDSYRLEAEITPDNATDKTLRWYSDDEDVATVDNGVVKALKTGEARITVESANGKTDVCVIEVIKHKTSSGGGSYSLEEGITKNDRDDETPVIGSEEESIFDDVSVNDPRYDAIKNVYEKGWMVGISDRVFAPEGTLTRAMGVTILWNKAGQPEPQGVAPFLDVTSDMWYAKAVAWAYEQGISAGYGDTFGPDDYLTTEQFTRMNDIANGRIPADYVGGAPYATRGWVAVMISEQ